MEPITSLPPGTEIKISVDVTSEDIHNGERNSCTKCPITRAVQRLFPDYLVETNRCTIRIFESVPFDDKRYTGNPFFRCADAEKRAQLRTGFRSWRGGESVYAGPDFRTYLLHLKKTTNSWRDHGKNRNISIHVQH